MKKIPLVLLSACLLSVLWWLYPAGSSEGETATLYTAKAFITMDQQQPRATAVAVRNGEIVAVGSEQHVRAQLPPGEYRVDRRFADKILLPGFIENHLHPAMAALLLPLNWITPFSWDLPAKTVAAVQGEPAYRAALQQAINAHPQGDDWFISWGYHHYFHGAMSRQLLDELAPDQPVIVWHRSFHEIFVNSAALAQVEFSAEELAGQKHVDLASGHFYETGLELALLKFKAQILAPGRFMQGLDTVVEVVHQGGITTVADMAAGMFSMNLEWLAMKWTLDDATTPFRTRLIPLAGRTGEPAGSAAEIAYNSGLATRNSERLAFVKQIKLLADGAFYSQLMQLREPGYLDGHHGEWLTPPDQLESIASAYWQAGYQLHIHTNGDLGAEQVLALIEKLSRQWPRPDHRTTLHHLGYIGEDQVGKIAELGVLVSANPYYLYSLGEKYSQMGLGPERAPYIFRGRSLLDAGVSLSLHSDFSMAPAKPLTLAWVAVNRIGAGGALLAPEQKISVHEALRAITIDAAFAIQMEDQVGSIEVGKKADFTVLEQDPYEVAPGLLKDIEIWGTVYEGQAFPL